METVFKWPVTSWTDARTNINRVRSPASSSAGQTPQTRAHGPVSVFVTARLTSAPVMLNTHAAEHGSGFNAGRPRGTQHPQNTAEKRLGEPQAAFNINQPGGYTFHLRDRFTSITIRPVEPPMVTSKKTLGLAISAGWTGGFRLRSFPAIRDDGPQGTEKDGGMWINFI